MAISGTLAGAADLVKMSNAVVEVSFDGSTWAAVESWWNTVEPTRGRYSTSVKKTLDGERHVKGGSLDAARVRATFAFTEDATDPFLNIYDVLGSDMDIRWSKSGTSGDIRFSTANGVLVDAQPPGFDAESDDVAMATIEIEAPDISQAAITP